MNFSYILSFLFLSSCAAPHPREDLVKKITKEYSKKVKIENSLVLSGTGSAIPDDIHTFILDFDGNQKLELGEVRTLVVSLVEDLLQMINNNPEIQCHLSNRPFTAKNYELRISFFESLQVRVEFPYVAYISLIDGVICYNYYDNKIHEFTDKTFKETYKEAFKIVKEEIN
jgi:hypothetical protein